MILFASIVAALGITLFLVSYIAKMLLAKRPGMGWVFLAWITGSVVAAIAMIPLGMFGGSLDPQVMFIITLLASFVISSAAYKYINQMGWGGAFTTNIASSVIGLIAAVGVVLVSGNSIQDTLQTVNQLSNQKSAMTGVLAEGGLSGDKLSEAITAAEEQAKSDQEQEDIADEEASDDDEIVKENDLLPKGAQREIAAKDKPYVAPRFHVVSISNISAYIGRPIRVKRSNGKAIKGSLVKVRGNNAVIKQRIHGGVATTPIALNTITKLEVYR